MVHTENNQGENLKLLHIENYGIQIIDVMVSKSHILLEGTKCILILHLKLDLCTMTRAVHQIEPRDKHIKWISHADDGLVTGEGATVGHVCWVVCFHDPDALVNDVFSLLADHLKLGVSDQWHVGSCLNSSHQLQIPS